jgi:hypothetical protein
MEEGRRPTAPFLRLRHRRKIQLAIVEAVERFGEHDRHDRQAGLDQRKTSSAERRGTVSSRS